MYLETNDLGAALRPIVDSRSFNESAKSKPDLAAVHGVQLAISVTGFETSEEKLTEEASALNFTPHFVAIAETHAWGWQTSSFAEDQLGEFVNKVYGGGVQLETASKNGGTEYIWTSVDGRKAYGFVTGSLIYFANDPSSLERVQAVRRGDAESMRQSGRAPQSEPTNLAFGYVTQEGIAQIANFIGAAKAKETGEEADVQSFVARVLPQLLRGTITGATWAAGTVEQGIEDRLTLTLNTEIASVLNETLKASDRSDDQLLDLAPTDAVSVTQYNLKDPQIAWRSVLLAAQKVIDPASGNVLAAFSNSFFEPYGVKDGETFLRTVSSVVTVRYEDDDDVAVIGRVKDAKARTAALDPELLKTDGANITLTDPGFETIALNGSSEVVTKCLQARVVGQSLRSDELFQLSRDVPASRTIGIDRDTAVLLAAAMSERKSEDAIPPPASRYLVETRFNKAGMERRLVSEFGLIGSIITMLAAE